VIARFAIGFVLAVSALPLTSAAAEAGYEEGMLAALQRFDRARVNVDVAELRKATEFFGLGDDFANRVLGEYKDFTDRQHRSGLKFLGEVPVHTAYFEDHGERKVIAFVDVVALFRHPMDKSGVRSERRRVYGFSRDAGKSWTFDILDCINEADLKRFDVHYNGDPAFSPPDAEGSETM
jgi:hypothetical protein